MNKKEMTKCIKWFKNTQEQITRAGGNTEYIMNNLPEDLLYSLVANDLYLVYINPDHGVGELTNTT